MNRQRGFMIPLAIGVVIIVLLGAALKVQTSRLDAVKQEYAGFVAQVKALGEIAQAKADAQMKAEKLDKEKRDANLKTLRGALAAADADLVRERAARTRGGYLPPASPKASDPSRATLDRAKFESAMGRLDERGAGIAKAGDGYRVGLDSLKTE